MSNLYLSFTNGLIPLLLLLWIIPLNGQPEVYVDNQGISGNTSSDLLRRLDRDVLKKNPDVCIILVGTNDLLNSAKMITLSEYSDNIARLIHRISDAGIEPVLISPPPVDTLYLFQRHDRRSYPQSPRQLLEAARDSMAGISLQENVRFIDLYQILKEDRVPTHNKDVIIQNESNSQVSDGVHLTAEGNQLLATLVYEKLKEEHLLDESVHIICFGDSLTYGVRMEGAGSSDGNTYPSYLKSLILSR